MFPRLVDERQLYALQDDSYWIDAGTPRAYLDASLHLIDGTRATDPGFQRAVDERLRREIERRGIPVLHVDGDDRDAWLDAVEAEVSERLASPQLALL